MTHAHHGCICRVAVAALLGLPVIAISATKNVAPAVLEEILVTAQKREERLQDIPMTLSALNGEALTQLGIDTPAELAAQTPGFKYLSIFGEGTNPAFFMRGIGLLDFGDVTETPVGLNLDGVYLGTQAAQAAPIFDVDRVEVIKGPQGTLYGRNSTGGVINVLSARPTADFEGRLAAQFGRFGQQIYEGVLSGPLAARARGRLSVRSNRDDGWQRSLTTGLDGYGRTDVSSARAQLDLDLAEDAALLLQAHYSNSDGTAVGYALTGLLEADLATPCSPERAAANACFNANGERGVRDPRVVLSEELPLRNENEFTLGSATYTQQLGEATLTSITALQKVEKLFQEDADAAAVEQGLTNYALDARQFTQEIRLGSRTEAGLQWIAGAFYFDERRDASVEAPESAPLFGVPFFGTRSHQNSTSWAGFGQLDCPLSDSVTLTAGARYTQDEKRISVVTPDFMPEQRRTIDTARTTGKLGLSWKQTADVMWYASVSTGFKAGGFNANFVFDPAAIAPVRPETITAYELGVKSELWDGRVRFNGAVFHYDYRDIQAVALDNDRGVNITRIVSLGDAKISGFDSELSLAPTDALRISLGVGLLDTELRSSLLQSSPFPPGVLPVDGNDLPLASDVSLNGLVQYTWSLSDAGSLTAQVDGDWRSEFSFTATGSREATEHSDGYGLVNGRLRWHDASERLMVEGFVENLTDKRYFLFNANVFPDNASGTWGRPRTWGVRLQFEF